MPSRTLGLSTALLALVLLIAACGSDGRVTTASDTEPDTTVASGVPDAFPPPPDPVDFDQLVANEEDVHVQWEVSLAADEVVAFYEDELPPGGWEIRSRNEGGESTRMRIEGTGWTGAVTVLDGDPVKVVLQLGRPDES